MMARPVLIVSAVLVLAGVGVARAQQPTPEGLQSAVDQLGSFEFATRTDAARLVRRASPAAAIPILAAAARSHADEYVRFRALVILSGYGESVAGPVMQELMGDRNDRVRTVAYQWFEHHPEESVLPALLAALTTEGSEFVRPALMRALAAHGTDPRVREALAPLVMRGEDLFRGALIVALGEYGGDYALAQILEVARLEGPLQDDAITAVGRMGDPATLETIVALQDSAPEEVQPTIAAAYCLLRSECSDQESYLDQVLRSSAADRAYQPMLRAAAHALGVLATAGRHSALTTLLDVGIPADEPVRAPIALAVGLVALREPVYLLSAIEGRADEAEAVLLVRDAFDMLSEDFEEERFSVELRRELWGAPVESARRQAAEALLDGLEF